MWLSLHLITIVNTSLFENLWYLYWGIKWPTEHIFTFELTISKGNTNESTHPPNLYSQACRGHSGPHLCKSNNQRHDWLSCNKPLYSVELIDSGCWINLVNYQLGCTNPLPFLNQRIFMPVEDNIKLLRQPSLFTAASCVLQTKDILARTRRRIYSNSQTP